jgi:hypothetical protein
MAAYPFRKMTTRQLRKLLRDERERNRLLKESPDGPINDPRSMQLFGTNPTQLSSVENSTESR